jgi:hypothetical protein
MPKHSEIWALISSLVEAVVDEAKVKATERDQRSPDYQQGQLHRDLEILRSTINLMRQLVFMQAVEDLIEASYYSRTTEGTRSNNKRLDEALRAFAHVVTTFSDME